MPSVVRVKVPLATAAALLAAVVSSLGAAAPVAPAPRGSILISSTRASQLHDEIWLLDLRSGRRLNISRNPAADRDPVLSPDGRTLAFVSDRGAREALWTMRPDGGGLRRIAGPFAERPNELVQVLQPSWSPDGRRLVFLTQRSTRVEARIVARDGGASTRVATGVLTGVESVHWSPDSRRLATTSVDSKGVWATVYDLRGRRIWRQPGDLAGWSARGELALAIRNCRAIVVVGPDGRIRRRASGLGALWSPDGLLLAVGDERSVRVLDERGRIRLKSTALRLGFGSSWSPNGRALLVFDGQSRPLRLNLAGRASLASPIPAGAAWTPDNALAVLGARGIIVPGRRPVRLLHTGWTGGLCPSGGFPTLRWLDRNRLLYAAGHGGQHAGDLWVVTGRQVRRLAGTAGGWRGGVAWSPDGSSIVYEHGSALSHGGGCSGPHTPHLRLADSSGGAVRVLTRSPEGYDVHPRWSPDGRQVVFERATLDDLSKFGILVVDVQTRTERRLTSGADTLPTWTADGLGVVYQHDGEIRRVAVADGKVTSVVGSGELPEAAPAGSLVAFLRGGALWTIRVDGSDARRLGLVQRQPDSPLFPPAEAPRWSPDGRRIAVADARGVLVFELSGGDWRLVAAPGAGGVAWSADGRTLSFHAPVGKYSRGIFNSGYVQRTELFTVPAGGGTPTRLTNDLANVLGAGAWRP